MKKFNCFLVLFNIPLLLYLLSNVAIILLIKPTISISYNIAALMLLLAEGVLFSINKRKTDIIAFIILAISVILGIIVGREEYLKWSSLYLAVSISIYYLIIYIIKMIYLKVKKDN